MLAMDNCLYLHKLGIKKPLTWVSGCGHQINAVRYSGWLLAIFCGRRQGGGVGLHLLLFALHVLDVNRLNGLNALFYKEN